MHGISCWDEGVLPSVRSNQKWIVIEEAYGIDSDGMYWTESEKWEKRKCIKMCWKMVLKIINLQKKNKSAPGTVPVFSHCFLRVVWNIKGEILQIQHCVKAWSLNYLCLLRTVKVVQSCPILCDPMDYLVHAILQSEYWSG